MMLHSIWYSGPLYYLFTLCNIAAALVTALFVRLFPVELDDSASAAGIGKNTVPNSGKRH
jgi:hypothetical protein